MGVEAGQDGPAAPGVNCGNVNFPARNQCNLCSAPKPQEWAPGAAWTQEHPVEGLNDWPTRLALDDHRLWMNDYHDLLMFMNVY